MKALDGQGVLSRRSLGNLPLVTNKLDSGIGSQDTILGAKSGVQSIN